MTVQIGLLGPLTVTVAGRAADPGSPMQRAVLAALALRMPAEVTREELVTMVWGDHAPASAPGNIQTYVSALRRVLEPDAEPAATPRVLATTPAGYRLALPPEAVDSHEFTRLAERGYRLLGHGHDHEAVANFDAALAYWTAEPLAGFHTPYFDRQRTRLVEQRLDVLEARSAALLELGSPELVVAGIDRVARTHPLREHLTVLLVEALAALGRREEALQVCAEAERILFTTIRVLPSLELAQARASLHTTHATSTSRRAATASATEFPRDVAWFTGREREHAALHELHAGRARTSPCLVVLHGEAGAGKTALAVRFCTRIATSYPDGQLYLDLRGHSPRGAPLPPREAAGTLLRQLGVACCDIPDGLDQRAARLRTTLAHRRVLLLLDNAADAGQVRPLVPGSDRCFTIVTSRNRLTALRAEDGAAAVRVGSLPVSDAVAVLRDVLGEQRIDTELPAARTVARQCDGLPLPLRIAAERATTRPQYSLTELADELEEVEHRLDVLSPPDDDCGIRTLLDQSYAALPDASARLLRLLGLFPGTVVPTGATAALGRTDRGAAVLAMRHLADLHLTEEVAPGSHRVPPLVRGYARERLLAEETPFARRAAAARLLAWQLHSTETAAKHDHESSCGEQALSGEGPTCGGVSGRGALEETVREVL